MPESSEPKITVRLETDPQGKPICTPDDSKRHYEIVFEIENPPTDTYSATFELDPSYYDSVREVQPDKDGKIRLKTTTFGDYPVIVHLHRTSGKDIPLREGVARALKRGRTNLPDDPQIDDALSYIAEN